MKFCFLKIMVILALVLVVPSVFADQGFIAGLEKKPLPRLKTPNVHERVLQNGMKLYLVEDHTIPIARVGVTVRSGGIYDDPDKLGLAVLTGILARSGGAGGLSPQKFDEAVDAIGAELSFASGLESSSGELSVLSGDLYSGLKLLLDMLMKPGFDEGRFSVARLRYAEDLRREKDNPPWYADSLFRKLIYGDKSPWARRPDPEGLSNIDLEDIRRFHGRFFKPGNMIVAAAGDFDEAKLVSFFKKYTKDIPNEKVDFPKVAEVTPSFGEATKLVTGTLSQSYIRIGHFGVKRHNPDWFAIQVLNNVMGASNFKSRLMEDVRTKKGLAYSISGSIGQAGDYGVFGVSLATGAKTADAARMLVKKHIETLATGKDVTDAEVAFAKKSLLSAAIFEIDSAFKIASARASFEFYGYPPDYWSVAYDGVEGVSRDDVNRAAAKYLHPDGLKTLIFGPVTAKQGGL